ncbi:short-chain dehydrogenase/reductase 2b-like [Dorcoceras hygrometricum]|uniref:Short-chain dehydrogenase/reductase 2b-like n=1 Tax=Dorcoceras hygrometricum TaxID=472368 RepID=A0A2Z7AZA7_9LAMI|nr:short-chain dehydrogenase/reductase 2b-like [Dorcoceras hygrometricum]
MAAENTSQKHAVVTGANKGIGLEVCRQLASKGITVVLTARDERRGLEAVEKLKKNPEGFLVNNAAILGATVDRDAFRDAIEALRNGADRTKINWNTIATMTYDLAVEALQTNYYGAKRTTEALLPFLQSSPSPRIVNVSSSMGKLKNIPNEWAKGVLRDAENLTEERIDQVLNEFLKSLKEGSSEAQGWPQYLGAYILSKAAMCAYTRIIAAKYPTFRINCLCPGFVSTDMNFNEGTITTEEGAEGPVMLAMVPDDGPSGLFFYRKEVSTYEE